MTVKELKQMLNGKFTNTIPFHTDRRKVIPYTQLGKEFNGLYGKEFEKVLDEKEVAEFDLSDWEQVICSTNEELKHGTYHYEMRRTLTIYFR